MNWLKQLLIRKRFYGDVSDEIQEHLDEEIEALVASGMPEKEAAAVARRKFGNVSLVEHDSRVVWQWPTFESLLVDVRYGMRIFRKNPGISVVAVLTIALGIGVTTAMFSVVNAVLIQPLPFKDADRLVIFHANDTKNGFSGPTAVCDADYVQWEQDHKYFDSTAAFHSDSANLTGVGEPEHLRGEAVTSSLFSLLGAQPQIGRTFLPEENHPGEQGVVVLSNALWARKFGSSPSVLGKSISLDAKSSVVVGVMPEKFSFPNEPDYWAPLSLTSSCSSAFDLVAAHLSPGVSLKQAQAYVATVSEGLDSKRPWHPPTRHTSAMFLKDEITSKVRPTLLVLFTAVGFVLLISCSNIASLLLARSVKREREIAVRTAIGASRRRIVRQLITESLALSLLGGLMGVLLTFFIQSFLNVFLQQQWQQLIFSGQTEPIRIDLSVMFFTLFVSIGTGVLFGLAPALHCAGVDPHDSLKQSGATSSPSKRSVRIRSLLVVSEFAFGVILMVSAGLLMKSFVHLISVNPGFNPEHLLTMQIQLPSSRYQTETQMKSFHREMLERIESLQGVVAAGTVSLSVPFGGDGVGGGFAIEGEPAPPPGVGAEKSVVSPNYFRAMQVPLLAGRYFSERDTDSSGRVMIINDSFARRFFPHQDPIGRRINSGWSGSSTCTVVGVVGDVRKYKLSEEPPYVIYLSYTQSPRPFLLASTALAVRTVSDPDSATNSVRAEIQVIDPDLPVSNVASMEYLVAQSVSQPRFLTSLFICFGCLALLLSAVGLYSLMSYSVVERSREIGVRVTLGARSKDVFWLVVKQGMTLALVGVSFGVVSAVAVTRVLKAFLFDISSTDPFILVFVPVVLILVGILAICVPASNAMRVDPIVVLKYE